VVRQAARRGRLGPAAARGRRAGGDHRRLARPGRRHRGQDARGPPATARDVTLTSGADSFRAAVDAAGDLHVRPADLPAALRANPTLLAELLERPGRGTLRDRLLDKAADLRLDLGLPAGPAVAALFRSADAGDLAGIAAAVAHNPAGAAGAIRLDQAKKLGQAYGHLDRGETGAAGDVIAQLYRRYGDQPEVAWAAGLALIARGLPGESMPYFARGPPQTRDQFHALCAEINAHLRKPACTDRDRETFAEIARNAHRDLKAKGKVIGEVGLVNQGDSYRVEMKLPAAPAERPATPDAVAAERAPLLYAQNDPALNKREFAAPLQKTLAEAITADSASLYVTDQAGPVARLRPDALTLGTGAAAREFRRAADPARPASSRYPAFARPSAADSAADDDDPADARTNVYLLRAGERK
jgi:hypothetical protein